MPKKKVKKKVAPKKSTTPLLEQRCHWYTFHLTYDNGVVITQKVIAGGYSEAYARIGNIVANMSDISSIELVGSQPCILRIYSA